MSEATLGDLDALEARIGVQFRDRRLLEQALVHRSYLNENPSFPLGSNERLEFLGDAVLGFVVADRLYRQFPDLDEGELTALRAALVRAPTLARVAQGLGLGAWVRMSRGELLSGGRERPRWLAQALEALIGAVYLDQGLSICAALIWRLLEGELTDTVERRLYKDAKSRLQELTQREYGLTPVYRTVAAVGPEHAKVFTVEVRIDDRVLGVGTGRSKRSAEQDAAQAALHALAPADAADPRRSEDAHN